MARGKLGARIVAWLLILAAGAIRMAASQSAATEGSWRVFSATAAVYDRPDAKAPPQFFLKEGDEISGEYVTVPESDEDWLRTTRYGVVVWVPRANLHRIHPDNVVVGNIPVGREKVDRWWGLPLDYEPDDLVPVPKHYRAAEDRDYKLRREACDALVAMLDAARADGIEIRVTSAYRAGRYQQGLYEKAVAKDGGKQRYSAPPGHSEHQLGTCVDLVDPPQRELFTEGFGDTVQGKWLTANAGRFGFRRSYTPQNVKDTGYISEPWHWRYIGKPQ